MLYKPEVTSATIVAIGAFNPAIFTPDWLEGNGLVGKDDANGIRDAANLVITRQVTVLEAESFALQIDEEKFQATCKGVLTPALRDLVLGILELLPQTPIRALGQNFDTVFKFFDEAAYHRVGDVLAPKDIWEKVYAEENRAIGLGTLTIQIQDGTRGKLRSADSRNITIQRTAAKFPAIRFAYNDHHDFAEASDDRTSAEHAAEVLRTTWEDAWHDSSRVFNQVLELVLGDK